MTDWNANQYIKFESQRTQPVTDLLNRIKTTEPASILDIGCGPGNSTAKLCEYFPNADIIGVDSSDDMLQKASENLPEVRFKKCRVPEELEDISEKFDLIFSNACIHWIPRQEFLIHAIFDKLERGGMLAVQIPMTQKQPFYKILNSVISDTGWKDKLGDIRNFYSLKPNRYYDILCDISDDFDIWETTYYHIVPSPDYVLEWFKGTGLRPYLNALDDNDKIRFERELARRVSDAFPRQKDGGVILRMPRLFFHAKKK